MANRIGNIKIRNELGQTDTLIPIPAKATSTQLGGVMPVPTTPAMTQPVGIDSIGRLFTTPSSSSGGSSDSKVETVFKGTFSRYETNIFYEDWCGGSYYAFITPSINIGLTDYINKFRVTWKADNLMSGYYYAVPVGMLINGYIIWLGDESEYPIMGDAFINITSQQVDWGYGYVNLTMGSIVKKNYYNLTPSTLSPKFDSVQGYPYEVKFCVGISRDSLPANSISIVIQKIKE